MQMSQSMQNYPNPNQIGSFPGYIPGPNIINPPNPVEQLNPYGMNIPRDLNYGVPGGLRGSQMPFLAGSINQSVNPYANVPNPNIGASMPNMGMMGPGQSVNPFDPNTNFLQQNIYNNPMVNPNNSLQNIDNMANNVAYNDPDLQMNQFLADRMKQRDKMKELTKEIYKRLTDKYGDKIQIVGDDLFCTNEKLLRIGIEEKLANAILIKFNQIGTVTESLNTIKLAKENGFKTIISHRSGETDDTFIADLSVGLDLKQIKTGSLSRVDRVSKYNRLMKINDYIENK